MNNDDKIPGVARPDDPPVAGGQGDPPHRLRREPRRPRWAALGLALALFLSGLAAGFAADRLLHGWPHHGPHHHHGPFGPPPDELTERLRRDLDLDAAQAQAVDAILRRHSQEMAAVLARTAPEMEAFRLRAEEQIEALLRPEQQQRYAKQRARLEQRRAEMRRQLELRTRQPPPASPTEVEGSPTP